MATKRKHRGGWNASPGEQRSRDRQLKVSARKAKPSGSASKPKPAAKPKPKPSARKRVTPSNTGKPINSGAAKRQQAITRAINRNK